ncbi:MAG: hypothetical protein K9J37_04425 [Saprospiraceae bacterium]|nr:hypothetical protein [Saprospiraceae bacterium]MCF8249131.1 hypothetical protein [Saprospiraceae bacterium]MCF8281388.1 hypothetical protein [Bacteroidales bacterium]MCF8311153.1 hypothetical protein [Saprospiraceae bacterium]MCF8440243.1 hypothetical protein [Saprospiraceae bacterium]
MKLTVHSGSKGHRFLGFSLIVLTVVISLPFKAISQERIGPYMAYSWRMGLSGGLNTAVCESSDGFLWIATGNGLIKFDGHHYQRILAGPGSISDNIVTEVASTVDGRSIWIGAFRRGAARFDLSSQKFRTYPKLWAHDSHMQSVRKILCLENGQVWLGTSGMGLALYLPQTDTFQFYTPEPLAFYAGEPNLSFNTSDMTPDPKDPSQIWLVCNNGIYRFDTHFKEFTAYPLPPKSDFFWTSIAHDGKDGLWLGSWGNSMFHFNTNTRRLTQLAYFNPKGQEEKGMLALDVEQINDTTVLWACALSGLLEYNPKTGQFKQALPTFQLDASSDTQVEYAAISKTKHAGVFIGAKGYLFQLHPYYSRLGKSIFPAPWAPNDEIYAGRGVLDSLTRQYLIPAAGPLGLIAIEQASLSAGAVPPAVKGLKALTFSPSGKIIGLGFDGILHQLDADKKGTAPIPLPCATKESITEMKMDKRGYLWALTQQNLYRLDAATLAPIDSFSFLDFEKPLDRPFSILYLYHLETNAAGAAWVGSSQGLWLAEPGKKQLTLFHPENKKGKWLKDKLIKSMTMDAEDRLWVGYNGDGLDIFDTKKLEIVKWPQGATMHARQINDLASTPGGYVLALTTEGLLAIDRTRLDWQLFGTEDGLFSQSMDKSLWVAPDGMVFVNHGTRLNVFHESSLQIAQEKLKVNILRLTINNLGQDLAAYRDSVEYLRLPYSSNNISITYSAMHWLYPFKTQYQYRFSTGKDSGEWIGIEEPFIQLNALQPGHYVLELGAKGAGGIPSLPKVLHIEIRPPFWKQTWFLLLCAGLLLLLFYAVYRFRLTQLKKQLEVRDTISKNLHDDIGSSLSNIQILNELARRNLGDQAKASTFLGRAGEDIRRISEALSEIVWNVNPKYDDLQFLFARMKRYAAESFEGIEIRYELDFPEDANHLKMGMEQRRDFYLIFKESIHNLVKYSGANMARVKVEVLQHKILLEVSDDGIGFSKTEGNVGNGLISMQQRAGKWTGKLVIKSTAGAGTSIHLSMPLK